MKKILFCALAALCLVACNQNEPTNTEKGGETISLNGRIYYCLQTGVSSDAEFYLEFGKPYSNMVTHTIHNIYHIEQESIPNENPYEWIYTFDGSNLSFETTDESHQTYKATYRNDSIFFMNMAYYRLLNR